MKNIVFDLGGVLFARNRQRCDPAMVEFFSFVRQNPMPYFWNEYDRGTMSLEQVQAYLCREKGCTPETCARYVEQAISMQEAIPATARLIGELKQAGYRLYVLSNMSREFIAFLRQHPVYSHFDGEVVSCEESCVKPEPAIYRILLDRYALEPDRTLFIDDRAANLEAAERFGLHTFLFDPHDPERSCGALRLRLLDKGELTAAP